MINENTILFVIMAAGVMALFAETWRLSVTTKLQKLFSLRPCRHLINPEQRCG